MRTTHRLLLPALLMALGCGGTPTQPEKLRPGAEKETQPTPPGKEKGSTAGKDTPKPPTGPSTVAELLKDAATVPTEKTGFSIGKVKFTVDTPGKPAFPKSSDYQVTLLLPDGRGGFRVGTYYPAIHDVQAAQKHWAAGDYRHKSMPIKLKQTILASPDTLVVEADVPGEERFWFLTNVNEGNLDLGVRFRASGEEQIELGTKEAVLTSLRSARSIKPEKPVPSDPVAAVLLVGGKVVEAGGMVTQVLLQDTGGTRSTLALLGQFPGTKEADLSWMNAGGDDLAVLEKVPALVSLHLNDTPVTDAGLKHVGKLGKLERLELKHAALTPAGIAGLAGLTELHTLLLDRNALAGDALAALGGLKKLRRLSLEQTGAGDSTLDTVGKLAELEELDLDGCPITDAGLAKLEGLKKLRTLNLGKTGATKAGVEKLQKALPTARIRS